MVRFCLLVFVASVLLWPGETFAVNCDRKPDHPQCPGGGGGGGSTDNTPPADITGITVHSSITAFTLEFSATGDDGLSGTAARYDVRYVEGVCAGDPSTWEIAERSDITQPREAGSSEYFHIRELTPATDHCLAIRAEDDAGNTSSFSLTEARTDSGPWSVSTVIDNRQDEVTGINVIDPATDPTGHVLAWANGRDSMSILQSDAPLLDNLLIDEFDYLRYIENTSDALGNITFAVSGYKDVPGSRRNKTVREWRHVFATIGPSHSSLLVDVAISGPLDTNGVEESDSAIGYRWNSAKAEWNPWLVYAGITEKNRKSKRSTLNIANKDSAGLSYETLFECQSNGGNLLVTPFFSFETATRTDGRRVIAFLMNGQSRIVIGEEQNNGTWTYRRSRALRSLNLQLALAADGSVEILGRHQTSNGYAAAIFGDAHFTQPVSASEVCNEPATEPAPPEILYDSEDFLYTTGFVHHNGNRYISVTLAEGNNLWTEQQFWYQCEGDPWQLEKVDRTQGGAVSVQMSNPDSILLGYDRGRSGTFTSLPPEEVIRARRTGDPCQ